MIFQLISNKKKNGNNDINFKKTKYKSFTKNIYQSFIFNEII